MAERGDQEERTEEATPRRRDEARDKGQVAFSSEFVAAAMMLAAGAAFALGGRHLASAAGGLVTNGLQGLAAYGASDLGLQESRDKTVEAVRFILPSVLVILLPMLLVGVLVGYSQIGVRFSSKAVGFDPEKLNPISGLKRIFGPRGLMRTGLGAGKILLVIAAVAAVAWLHVPRVAGTAGTGVGPMLAVLGTVMIRAVGAGVAVVLLLSVVDLLFQRFQHTRDLRMTRKEVKDEAKNTEGDPLVRSRIRQVQRELASRRMMSEVPDATVVVTNPTHVAVALRYDDGSDRAPRVVAKGLDHVAQKIKEIARENGVVVYEEPPLARALHRDCEIDDVVPEDLFEAVARVLAYVYRVQGRAVSA